jgi:D-alanyl-D-alanine carboxypeptidase
MKRLRKKKKKFLRISFLCLIIGVSFYIYKPKMVSSVLGKITSTSLQNNNSIGKSFNEIYTGDLILVNNNIPFHFNNQKDLVSVYDNKNSSYKVKDKNVLLKQNILKPLNTMMSHYINKTDNKDIIIVSGYRTAAYQQMLFDKKKSEIGEKETKKLVALPGSSEHHTGLAFDLGALSNSGVMGDFDGTGKQAWFIENAYQYGFIVRYQTEKETITGFVNEPWHLRYVGIPHAQIMKGKNMCLEEYIDYLKQFEYKGKKLETDAFEIYFVKADNGKTQIPVPNNKEYTVSGNNVDGFIVTVVK